MDDNELQVELARLLTTKSFNKGLVDIECESRNLRCKRLQYVNSLAEAAGEIARDIVRKASSFEGVDADNLCILVRDRLVQMTRDAF